MVGHGLFAYSDGRQANPNPPPFMEARRSDGCISPDSGRTMVPLDRWHIGQWQSKSVRLIGKSRVLRW